MNGSQIKFATDASVPQRMNPLLTFSFTTTTRLTFGILSEMSQLIVMMDWIKICHTHSCLPQMDCYNFSDPSTPFPRVPVEGQIL